MTDTDRAHLIASIKSSLKILANLRTGTHGAEDSALYRLQRRLGKELADQQRQHARPEVRT